MNCNVRFLPCGDCAVTAEFGNAICEDINTAVHNFALAVESLKHAAICEVVPTYRSATVYYFPELISYSAIIEILSCCAKNLNSSLQSSKTIKIPVLYGGAYGEDLAYVAAHNGITEQDVIAIHSGRDYRVFMLGFTPGFPYLGGMDSRIATPRRAQPRVKIAAGSVGIAGEQTGIYPISSPGGWQLIGRTPLVLFDPLAQNPILIKAGEKIRFVPIDEAEYNEILRGARND